MLKVAILGVGSRGAGTYGDYFTTLKDRVEITALCDIDQEKLSFYGEKYGVNKENRFTSYEDFFKAGKLADLLVIATLDKMHYIPSMTALDLGYHLLLEKPISPSIEECIAIENKAKEKNKTVIICHVLRYTTFYRKIKEIVDSGALGKIVNINTIENVGYWHQAHSFVRGNWHKSEDTAPMILAKCCHDMDLLNWIINKKPINITSYGHLSFFKKEFAPEGSSDRCYTCKVRHTCPYDAIRYYVDATEGKDNLAYPYDVVVLDPTHEKLKEAMKTSPYGKCVFQCDNDVVDHQVVNLQYEDEITASHTMVAFSNDCYRTIRIYGTHGDLEGNTLTNMINVKDFLTGKEIVIDASKLTHDLTGHLGGDHVMMNEICDLFEGKETKLDSSIEKSVLSHLVCMAAEESRLNAGKSINIQEYKNSKQ